MTLAGFDGTGGAGISADIKVSSFLGVPNVSVVTSIVIQSPFWVKKKIDLKPEIVRNQINALEEFYDFRIVNIGLLGDLKVLGYVMRHFADVKIVWDPIFASGSGKYPFIPINQLDKVKPFLKRTFLITPNIPEAEVLAGFRIKNQEDIRKAAIQLRNLGAHHILIKGGHLKSNICRDTLFYFDKFFSFTSPKKPFRIHGTGSFLNAAISGYLFLGEELVASIEKARILLENAVKKTTKTNPILQI